MASEVISTAAFSSNEEDALTRRINTLTIELDDVETYFDLGRCVEFVENNNYAKVALQFPDELLPYAYQVATSLKERCQQYVFILGDTSYGSCCVDEIAAEHLQANCVIHFGKSCLSRTSRLPVLFVFGQGEVDISDCVASLDNVVSEKETDAVLLYETEYTHLAEAVHNRLLPKFPNLLLSRLCLPSSNVYEPPKAEEKSERRKACNEDFDKSCCQCGRETGEAHLRTAAIICKHFHNEEVEEMKAVCRFGRYVLIPKAKNVENYTIIYLGKEDLTLRNLMFSYSKNAFYTYNPALRVARRETLNVNRSLMKRYYLIQKAKEAQIVGIVIGTLGVENYLAILARMKKMLKLAGKKYYTFVVGKLNVAKLANFMEIDIFVLIACSQNSLIDSQEFYKPVITPFELEVACLRAREWTGDYITDFKELLPGSAEHVELKNEDKQEEPEYSFLTGNLLSRPDDSDDLGPSDALVERSKEYQLALAGESGGAAFLMSRSWKGLEKKVGETAVTKAGEGRSGIAASYTHEPHDVHCIENSSDAAC